MGFLPPCEKHGLRPSVCVSREIGARVAAGVPLDLRCRAIYLAYLEQPPDRAFTVAYLDDEDYAQAAHRAAGRLPEDEAYAADPVIAAMVREMLAGDIPLLIDRARSRRRLNDAGLIRSAGRRMRKTCPACLEEALDASGQATRHAPRVGGS